MTSHQSRMNRRRFLKSSSATIAMPLLASSRLSSQPSKGGSESPLREFRHQSEDEAVPRTVAICAGLGFHGPNFFPDQSGFDYQPPAYLELLRDHRDKLTIFSGLSHPEQNGNNGHASSLTWLTSARRPGLSGFKNTISLDQLMANQHAGMTRFPFLCLANDGGSLSWTANGINIPSERSPAKLFQAMFVDGTEQQQAEQLQQLGRGRSVLDTVLAEANQLNRTLSDVDQRKLDEYFTAIRELEIRIGQNEAWTQRPKPVVEYEQPTDVADRQDIVAKQRLMYDMMTLALQTDSTRVITLSLGGMNAVPSNIEGVTTDWHNLSHHGRDEKKISELGLIEQAEFIELARFLDKLSAINEQDETLLDRTAVLFGSNLGNASAHDWTNLPIMVAGGGYRHGQHLQHDAENNTPLSNLFVSLAQRMGVAVEQFGSSTSAGITGFEV